MRDTVQLKNTYLSYNSERLDNFLNGYSRSQVRLIRFLPLLMHTNVNLMPGFVSPHTPHGIADYLPDYDSLTMAAGINKKFSYDPDDPPRPTNIDALFIQQCFITGEVIFWVIHSRHLEQNQIDLLQKKTKGIVKWLAKAGIRMNDVVCDAANISYSYYSLNQYSYHIDKCFFLDNFYAESILLAGKPPGWWLHVNEHEEERDNKVIHCGELITPRTNDYFSAAIWHLFNIFRQPHTSWINLEIIDQFINHHIHSFFSPDLRDTVHQSANVKQINPLQEYVAYLKDIVNIRHSGIDHHTLSKYHENLDDTFHQYHETVFSHICTPQLSDNGKPDRITEFNHYRDASETLIDQCESLFRRIKTYLNLSGHAYGESQRELNAITSNLLSRLVKNDDRIVPVNTSKHFLLDRVHIRHDMSDSQDEWSLMSDEKGNRQEIHRSSNLISLIAWAFINRLVDASTQISIHCEELSIRQIDLHNIVMALAQNIDKEKLADTDINHYLSDPEPVQSILFIGHHSHNFREQTIDHLIVNNTGEVFIREYLGLHVFNTWFQSSPKQTVCACLYGYWANDYRNLNRKILSKIGQISIC